MSKIKIHTISGNIFTVTNVPKKEFDKIYSVDNGGAFILQIDNKIFYIKQIEMIEYLE